MKLKLLFLAFLSMNLLFARSDKALQALYGSLDPTSIMQNFAFYELYSESPEGKKALQKAWDLLTHNQTSSDLTLHAFPKIQLKAIINLVGHSKEQRPRLKEEEINLIKRLSEHFPNRRLKGYHCTSEEEVLNLSHDQVDIVKALFLSMGQDKSAIDNYEAAVDLMALQIAARLPENATALEKIEQINQFIFHEMHFRFPPHSLWANDIDVYTFLPSVIDNREGVCLGVSVLYLCLAQRLDLDLEIITPPGHIYVRYVDKNKKITNIETTARGIDTPTETYLGIETKNLQSRNNKELIGLTFINAASVSWIQKKYQQAVALYEKAVRYLPDDFLLKELLAYNYLFVGNKKKAIPLLRQVQGTGNEFSVSKETIAEDYLRARCDAKAIQAVFLSVDETRSSIVKKQKILQKCIKKYPKFRAGLLQLAGTWLQLGREKEALKVLKQYEKIDDEAVVYYYLTVISMKRKDYTLAWNYLVKLNKLLDHHKHHPQALEGLQQELAALCPKP